MNREKLQKVLSEEVREEWNRLHHNASLAHCYPETRNDYEYSLFSDCLGDRVSQLFEYLKEEVKEETGYNLTFYQYGRQGATVAPSEWMAAAGGGSFGSLRDTIIGYDDDPDAARETAKVLRALRLINNIVIAYAADIPRWWKETKAANGWARKIRSMDGKKPRQVTVWR